MSENCFYCGLPMKDANMTNAEAMQMLQISKGDHGYKRLLRYMRKTTEHLVKRCDGGGNQKSNLVQAHAYCNSSRGNATVCQHKEMIVAKLNGGYHPLSVLNYVRENK